MASGFVVEWRIHTGIGEFQGGVGLLLLFAFAMSWIGVWLRLMVRRSRSRSRSRSQCFPADVPLERVRADRDAAHEVRPLAVRGYRNISR